MEKDKKMNLKTVFKIAGAFIAWLIGSGFATGQEILQFFSGHGYLSYGVVLLSFFGFVILGQILLATGNEHRGEEFDHFTYYCGDKLGKIYFWLVPLVLFLIISVMISAAGAALYENFGVNRHIASALMAILVVAVYLAGFEKMVGIVSSIGPVIIIFVLSVGIIIIVQDFNSFSEIADHKDILAVVRASKNWVLSSVLYMSLCIFTASTYYTELGKTAANIYEARAGAALGAVVFIMALAVINTAILLNAEIAVTLAIPNLYLASKISYVLGGIFSIILVAGIFASASTMMWSVCSRFYIDDISKNRIFAMVLGCAALILGQFSFSKLLGILYPFIGCVGLVFLLCVVLRQVKRIRA